MIRLDTKNAVWAVSMMTRNAGCDWQTDNSWETATAAALFSREGCAYDHSADAFLVDYGRFCDLCDAGEYYTMWMRENEPDRDFNFSCVRVAIK